MSYIPYEWKKGDKITAERLNNIEEGIGENTSTSQSNDVILHCDLDVSEMTLLNEEEIGEEILNASIENIKLKLNISMDEGEGGNILFPCVLKSESMLCFSGVFPSEDGCALIIANAFKDGGSWDWGLVNVPVQPSQG